MQPKNVLDYRQGKIHKENMKDQHWIM